MVDETDLSQEKSWWYETLGQQVVASLQRRNITAFYVPTGRDAFKKVLELIPEGATVGWGDSTTIYQIGVFDELTRTRPDKVFDSFARKPDGSHTLSPPERLAVQRKAVTADVFLAGINAVTIDGRLVSTDMMGKFIGIPIVAQTVNAVNKVVVVRKALDAGHAAATILPSNIGRNTALTDQLRIAFDGDAVLFSDEAERVYRTEGLDAFTATEVSAAREPLSGGPFKSFLAALHRIQSEYPPDASPIRTGLVTARSAPAHERVVRTLRAWNIRIDEALFLGGRDKGEFLKAFGADIFFDDSQHNIESARRHVAAGHVPHGIAND